MYNLQLPHTISNFLLVAMVIRVAMFIMAATVKVVVVVMVVVANLVVGTGRDGAGRAFKLYFSGNL